MRSYREITWSRTEVENMTCDLCAQDSSYGENWATDNYHYQKVTLEYDDREQYPEGGWGVKQIYDICPECWENVLIPLLKIKPTIKEYDI